MSQPSGNFGFLSSVCEGGHLPIFLTPLPWRQDWAESRPKQAELVVEDVPIRISARRRPRILKSDTSVIDLSS